MMRDRSPPSELIFRENEGEKLSVFVREFGKGVNLIFVKIS